MATFGSQLCCQPRSWTKTHNDSAYDCKCIVVSYILIDFRFAMGVIYVLQSLKYWIWSFSQKDIRVFIGLMALVYFGYSIALYSVLEPYQNPNRHSLPEMVIMILWWLMNCCKQSLIDCESTMPHITLFLVQLFIPYFQIYGELFLDDMREKTACPNIDFTDCGGHPVGIL